MKYVSRETHELVEVAQFDVGVEVPGSIEDSSGNWLVRFGHFKVALQPGCYVVGKPGMQLVLNADQFNRLYYAAPEKKAAKKKVAKKKVAKKKVSKKKVSKK